jgi:hypothetical protein
MPEAGRQLKLSEAVNWSKLTDGRDNA